MKIVINICNIYVWRNIFYLRVQWIEVGLSKVKELVLWEGAICLSLSYALFISPAPQMLSIQKASTEFYLHGSMMKKWSLGGAPNEAALDSCVREYEHNISIGVWEYRLAIENSRARESDLSKVAEFGSENAFERKSQTGSAIRILLLSSGLSRIMMQIKA